MKQCLDGMESMERAGYPCAVVVHVLHAASAGAAVVRPPGPRVPAVRAVGAASEGALGGSRAHGKTRDAAWKAGAIQNWNSDCEDSQK